MILVDTSVWIRALLGRAPYREGLDKVLEQGEAAGHAMVFGELLMGNRGGRSAALATVEIIPWARAATHREVVALVRGRGLAGSGFGWVDAHLLAAALLEQWPLWTADEQLAAAAAELGVGWNG